MRQLTGVDAQAELRGLLPMPKQRRTRTTVATEEAPK